MSEVSQPSAAATLWRVVLIDDNPDDRATVRLLLDHGLGLERRFQIEEAETAQEGLALIESGPRPHCVLLDYYLPDAQAEEVLAALSHESGAPFCPVVVLTGLSTTLESRAALRAGAQDFIGKDAISSAGLARALENAYERWSLTVQLREREARLREREQELELAFDAAKLMYFSWDVPADRVERRMSWLSKLPSTESQTPGPTRFREVVEVVHPEDRALFESNVNAALGGGGQYASTYRVNTEAGVVWLEERGRVWFDPQGRPQRLAGVSVDTTAHRLAEAQQQRVAEQQRLLLDVARLVLEAPAADADLSRRVFEKLAHHFDADVLLHYQVDGPELRLLASAGVEHALVGGFERLELNQAFCGRVASSGTPLAADASRIASDPGAAHLRRLGARAYSCHPLFDRGGKVLGTYSVGSTKRTEFSASDVHTLEAVCRFLALAWDRQRAEDEALAYTERLERSHDTFYELIARNPFGLFVVDADFCLRQASEGTLNASRNARPLLGQHFADVLRATLSADQAQEIEQRFRCTLASGESYRVQQSLVLPERREPMTFDWRIERIELPDQRFGVVCYYYDLSERERLEAALLTRERELQTLADNSPDILVRFDTQLRHVFVNRALTVATGRGPEHFLGKTCEESHADPQLCKRWSAGVAQVIAQAVAGHLEFTMRGPQGERFYASTLLPERDASGRVVSVLAVTHDITDQRRIAEVLQQADRRKDEFLATLAHELRNPLAPLRTGISLLQHAGADRDTQRRACEVMERQLAHMVRLVDDLLDLSRISRGKIELQRTLVSAQSIIEQALELSQPLIDAGQHTLTLSASGSELWIDGDLTRLSQVVSNLLNNAAKYTPSAGEISLHVDQRGDDIVITVQDTGSGIAADTLPYVFDLFTQSEHTRGRAQGGLGIGLSLVKRLVEMHGGSVGATSDGVDQGSTFWVRLPVARSRPQPTMAAALAPLRCAQTADAPARRVLVVDDNEDAAEMLATTLSLRGHETATAFTGPEALATAQSFDPDVVLLDIGLPDMDGHEVARAFQRDLRLRRAVLVALTGWGSDTDKVKSKEAGFAHHLVKPADVQAVHELLVRTAEPR